MSKPVLGLLLGGILGIFDGLTAYFTPEVRSQLLVIVVGSTVKGLIAGVSIGFFSKKVASLPLGVAFGLGVGLLLAFLVAAMPSATGRHYYIEIMLPGAIVGAIVGYATQRWRGRLSPGQPSGAARTY
jgi:cytochrome b subunit of formate dehydrogenase